MPVIHRAGSSGTGFRNPTIYILYPLDIEVYTCNHSIFGCFCSLPLTPGAYSITYIHHLYCYFLHFAAARANKEGKLDAPIVHVARRVARGRFDIVGCASAGMKVGRTCIPCSAMSISCNRRCKSRLLLHTQQLTRLLFCVIILRRDQAWPEGLPVPIWRSKRPEGHKSNKCCTKVRSDSHSIIRNDCT